MMSTHGNDRSRIRDKQTRMHCPVLEANVTLRTAVRELLQGERLIAEVIRQFVAELHGA